MRIKVEQAIVSGNDLKIVANRRRKIYKTSSAVRRRDLRGAALYIENGANCDCASLEQTQHVDGSSRPEHERFLVTGSKRGDRLMVEYIQPFGRRSKELRRAVRAIRQRDVCEEQSVIADVGTRSRTEGGRGGHRRPRKHRGDASTMETATTTTTTTTEASSRNDGRRSRNRHTSPRRNRGRSREARQRAKAARRQREQSWRQ